MRRPDLMREIMSDKKYNKAAHGRHAAGAQRPNDTDSEQVVSPVPSDSSAPDATAAMPPASASKAEDYPLMYASEQVYASPDSLHTLSADAMAVPRRRRRPLKVLAIVLGVIVALAAVAYIGGSVYFFDRFMPNSTIGNVDVSLMSSADAERSLASSVKDYKLTVTGQGFTLKLTAADAGLSLDSGKIVQQAHADVSPWTWPLELARTHDATDKLVASFNESGLEQAVRKAVETFNETATPPTDATVAYDESVGAFVVKAEAPGTALDADAVVRAADEALVALNPTAKLTADHLKKPTVLSSDQRLKAAADSANTMIKANLTLTMGGTEVGAVNPGLVSQWVVLGEDVNAALNEDALTAWVDGVVAACDTVGTARTYTRPDGKVITVQGGPYGWDVDRDALLAMVKEAVAAGSVQSAEVPTFSSGTAFNGAGAQDWGARYCDIDLSEQYVRFYDASGALIWEAPCVSGTPNGAHNTPTGVYVLNSKASPSVLKGTNLDGSKYESTVQYWMPFVGNVIGMHDADWQPYFGGTRYQDGGGSHGCVNLPPSSAAALYGIIQPGDVVVSHW